MGIVVMKEIKMKRDLIDKMNDRKTEAEIKGGIWWNLSRPIYSRVLVYLQRLWSYSSQIKIPERCYGRNTKYHSTDILYLTAYLTARLYRPISLISNPSNYFSPADYSNDFHICRIHLYHLYNRYHYIFLSFSTQNLALSTFFVIYLYGTFSFSYCFPYTCK